MSNAAEQHEISEESPYGAHVDALLHRLSDLAHHIQKMALPPLRHGVTAPPDMTSWPTWRKFAFALSSPLLTAFTAEFPYPGMMLSIWAFVSSAWLSSADVIIDSIFGTDTSPASQPEQALWVDFVVYAMLVWVFGLILAAYWRWLEFALDQRYPRKWRIFLTGAFVAIAISSPFWLLAPENRVQFPDLLLRDGRLMGQFIIAYLSLVIPAGTFYYMLAIDVFVLSIRLVRIALKYLRFAHAPFPKELVRRLVIEPIPASEDEGMEWWLAELKESELEVLHRWATANREGTEKRLLPTAILFGVLGVFADTDAFSLMADKLLSSLSNGLLVLVGMEDTSSLSARGGLVALLVVLAVGAVFVVAMQSLFHNLLTQSLIIEACIVAEYACTQRQSPDSKAETDTNHGGFWARLLRLLWRR
jgi:hypothetical protein